MSIILIDDIVFSDLEESRILNHDLCLYFFILNAISIFFCIIFIIFYIKMPHYHNKPNSLTLYLILAQSIINLLYFILFGELSFGDMATLPLSMIFFGIINPVLHFFLYFWNSCLVHNIYVTYYNYKKSLDKRIKFYKYQGIIYSLIVLFITFFNVHFESKNIMSKTFSFTKVYNPNYLTLFYLIALIFQVFIIYNIYFIFKKDTDFLTLSIDDSRNIAIRRLFKQLIYRHLVFIIYFILSYFPMTICMIIRTIFNYENFESFYLNFFCLSLISLYGTLIFCIKLTDPVMRGFLYNIIFWNKDIGVMSHESSKALLDINSKIYDAHSNTSLNIKKARTDLPYNSMENNPENDNKRIEMESYVQNYNFNDIIESNPNNLTLYKRNNMKKLGDSFSKISKKNSIKTIKKSMIKATSEYFPSNSNDYSSNNSSDIIVSSEEEDEIKSCHSEDNKKNYINPIIETVSKGKNLLISRKRASKKYFDKMMFKEGILAYDLMYYHIDLDDNLLRMLAITVAINENRIYDFNYQLKKKYFNCSLPWEEDKYYKQKSKWKEYNQTTIPDWVNVKNDNRFKKFNFRIKEYCPFVFHHLRCIDNVSIDDIIRSLDPIKNLSKLRELKVNGGRGDNSISTTWDKKILLKTINKTEKKIFIDKMIKEYHSRIRDTKSLLCRIYGLFEIDLNDKGNIHVLLQKNMDDLPSETKIITFDLKGSTVDRQCINEDDINLGYENLINKYKNKVLKDIDLEILKMNFILHDKNARNLKLFIEKDTRFLEKFGVTDYSLLVFIHKYRKKDINDNLGNLHVMQSKYSLYIYDFSIIDFLGTFGLEKKGEKLAKELIGYINQMKDTNFSVLEPSKYGDRFRKYIQKIVPIKNEDEDD